MSKLDDAYVALRNLLRARFTSDATRQQALRAVEVINKEAREEAVLDLAEIRRKDAA